MTTPPEQLATSSRAASPRAPSSAPLDPSFTAPSSFDSDSGVTQTLIPTTRTRESTFVAYFDRSCEAQFAVLQRHEHLAQLVKRVESDLKGEDSGSRVDPWEIWELVRQACDKIEGDHHDALNSWCYAGDTGVVFQTAGRTDCVRSLGLGYFQDDSWTCLLEQPSLRYLQLTTIAPSIPLIQGNTLAFSLHSRL
ncbi:hypothetical protein JCM5296_000241 [Sporobolomyces johnsonii]